MEAIMNLFWTTCFAIALMFGSVLLSSEHVNAAGTTQDDGPLKEANLAKGITAIDNADWSEAISHLKEAVKADSQNADAQNFLAFAYRKSGQLDPAFDHYAKALAINPKHKGANEYIGRAYLLIGNLEKAQEHLKTLKNICGNICKETSKLKKAIARYKENADKQVLLEEESNW